MVNSFLAHHLGPVINEFGSANGPYALQAQARRRVVAVLRQGAATPACDAYGPFPPGSFPNSLMTGPSNRTVPVFATPQTFRIDSAIWKLVHWQYFFSGIYVLQVR